MRNPCPLRCFAHAIVEERRRGEQLTRARDVGFEGAESTASTSSSLPPHVEPSASSPPSTWAIPRPPPLCSWMVQHAVAEDGVGLVEARARGIAQRGARNGIVVALRRSGGSGSGCCRAHRCARRWLAAVVTGCRHVVIRHCYGREPRRAVASAVPGGRVFEMECQCGRCRSRCRVNGLLLVHQCLEHRDD